MKTNIPVTLKEAFSEENVKRALRESTEDQKKVFETQGEKEQKEILKSFEMDWKTFAIGSLIFALVLCFVGYNLRDTGLQNSLETITNEKQNIRKQEMIIVKAQESISGSTAKIEGAKEVLKNSYKLIVQ